MKRNFSLLFLLFSSTFVFGQNNLSNSVKLGTSTINEVVSAMTLEEKANLVIGTGLRFEGNGPVIGEADGRVPGAAGNTLNFNRFGIPGTVLADGPAGVRIDATRKNDTKTYYATAWPVGTLLASSWDTTLVHKVGVAFGNEIREYGVDVILAPGMNIQRDPLNGRNFEYYSEDPLVTGLIGSAMVKGIQSNGVGTSVKHFAANNQETKRNSIDAMVSERALREIYLKGFELVVKNARPWTIMSSYNKINGVYTSESKDLLTSILRDEWGFKGIVMTDWYGGRDAVAQMIAGNDLIEPGSKSKSQNIIDGVKNGMLDEKVLDRNVTRILEYILKTPSYSKYQYSDKPDLKAHAQIARQAAVESMVLLKNNENILPLKKGTKIALFGVGSYQTVIGGTGSGQVNVAYSVNISEGFNNAGFTIQPELSKQYTTYIQEDKLAHPKKGSLTLGAPRMVPEYSPSTETIENAVNSCDVAVFTLSRNSGEGADRTVKDNFNLTENEQSIIKTLAQSFHQKGKKFVVILNIGGVIETASWRDWADAVLLAWQPGIEAGNSVADVLSGAVNPSGKLAVTFPVNYSDEPGAKNFPGLPVENPTHVKYEEGIYVGYRYFSSFAVKPAYSFGFGLSYTQFAYSNLKLNSDRFNKKITATVVVKNTGKVPGKEVVQLYISAPVKTVEKPELELKGFAKTGLLKPGESQTITFTIDARSLASFNTEVSSWVADAGNYTVKIGASVEDIKLTKNFALENDLEVERVHKALVPQVKIEELSRK